MAFLKKHFYLFALLLLLTFGCRSCDTVESTKVAQSEIYQDYSITASGSGTSVTATFRVGGSTGTTVDLDAPSKVEYNGRELTENLRSMLTGTNYTTESNEFQGSHQFTYTNGDGRVFQNAISFDPLDPLPGVREIRPKEKTIIILSRPLRDDESIDATLSSLEPTPTPAAQNGNSERIGNRSVDTPSYSQSLRNTLTGKRTAIEIGPGDLRDFVPGKAVLRITVRGSSDLQQKTGKGGTIGYTYTSQGLGVTVLK
jgi:hypothetical protein